MRNFKKEDIELAKSEAKSYRDFKENLRMMGNKVPQHVGKFPTGMKSWIRKLRYEISKDFSFGTPTTGHDLRQAAYYKRLEEMGCPEPLQHMQGHN